MYTLIIVLLGANLHSVVFMHDFPTLESCQQAAEIAKQLVGGREGMSGYEDFRGARCLKVN